MQRLRSENTRTGKVYYFLNGKRVTWDKYHHASVFHNLYAFYTICEGDMVRNYSSIGKSFFKGA